VAAELADLRTAALKSSDSKDEIKLIDRAVLETLQQSYDCGWPREIDLGAEKQFASFKQNEQFAAKIAEFNQRSRPTEGAVGKAASTSKSN